MSWGNSEDAIDYDNFAEAIDLVEAFGCPAHLLDITLTDEGTPGEITVLWNGLNVDPADRADASERPGQERTHAIHRSGPFVGNIREIRAATGIALIRAQAAYRSEGAP